MDIKNLKIALRGKFSLYGFFVRFFSAAVSPFFCGLCGKIVPEGTPLCSACTASLRQKAERRMLFAPEKDWCAVCGHQLVSADAFCPECRDSQDFVFLEKICALFPYSPENSALLSAWKLHGVRGYSRVFAEILAALLRANSVGASAGGSAGGEGVFDGAAGTVAVVPVPPRPGKIRKAGWDQIRELCGVLRRVWRIPVCDCLVRTSKIQQKQLGKAARKMNLKGHILVKKGCTPPKVSVLIDDIVTTGATLENCAEALRAAGSSSVVGLTLFYDL